MANILVIDDELSIRKTFYALLRQEGHQVVCVENTDQGLEKLHQIEFDLIITDIYLPGTNGNEILQRIREQNPGIATILMTGAPQIETIIDGIRAGASDYLTKPVHKEALLRSVSRTIKQKSLLDLNKRLSEENMLYQNHLESMVMKKTASLSNLLRRIIEIQDLERSTLGHRVHEFLYQHIKNLRMEFESISENASLTTGDQASVASILNRAEAAARKLSATLNPVNLKQSGISTSIRSLAEAAFRDSGIQYSISLKNTDARFSEGWDLHLYRILEEIITNCIRHSGAEQFSLTDEGSCQEQLVVEARDDGSGLPEEVASGKSEKLGLYVLHERVRMIDGKIKYGEDGGTKITLVFPLKNRGEQ